MVWLPVHLLFDPRHEGTCVLHMGNKATDQPHSFYGSCAADQHLCFLHTDSKIPFIPKFDISSLQSSSVTVDARFASDLVRKPRRQVFLYRGSFTCNANSRSTSLSHSSTLESTSLSKSRSSVLQSLPVPGNYIKSFFLFLL